MGYLFDANGMLGAGKKKSTRIFRWLLCALVNTQTRFDCQFNTTHWDFTFVHCIDVGIKNVIISIAKYQLLVCILMTAFDFGGTFNTKFMLQLDRLLYK